MHAALMRSYFLRHLDSSEKCLAPAELVFTHHQFVMLSIARAIEGRDHDCKGREDGCKEREQGSCKEREHYCKEREL